MIKQIFKFEKPSLFESYLLLISLIGVSLIVAGISQLPNYDSLPILGLLSLLAVGTQFTNTLAGQGAFLSVATAIYLSAVPLACGLECNNIFLGPLGAVLVVVSGELSSEFWNKGWLTQGDKLKQIRRALVNTGMNGIATFVAGLFFTGLKFWLGLNYFDYVPILLLWVLAGIIHDQVNIWILISIIYLQHGIPPLDVWKDHRWAAPINITVMVVGGGVLAIAANQVGALGLVVFFLPILTSSYSVRAYTKEKEKQMQTLEDLVQARTQALEDANIELSNLHKEKDDFFAVLTHDMRTPLTSIGGYATLMRDYPDLPTERRDHMVNVILRNQETLLDMVNNILEIKRMQSGEGITLSQSNFDLCILIDDVVELGEASAMEKSISLSTELPSHPVYIHADEHKLKRVVTNLVSNGIKYTPDGGAVSVTLEANQDEVYIKVQDTGYGIPPEDLPHIFDRFKRVNAHQNIAVGTGLGLSIVQSLIEAHGGEIFVTSEVNEGSVFTIRLPT